MRTSKAISTISFNTEGFLVLKLDELLRSKIISTWHFICHRGEGDEAGKKDHIHLYLEPSKLIQTDDLIGHFKEIDPKNVKPLSCLPFRVSRFDHWYYYAIHNEQYLQSLRKPLERKYHYTYEDIKTSNSDELYRAVSEIDVGVMGPINMLKKAKEAGESFEWLVGTGRVPIPQIRNYERAFSALRVSGLSRGYVDASGGPVGPSTEGPRAAGAPSSLLRSLKVVEEHLKPRRLSNDS